MPRPNIYASLVPFGQSGREVFPPPPDLSPATRAAWLKVVASVPPGHFQPTDEPLLRHFATAIVAAERCAVALEAEPDVTKLPPLIEAHAHATRAVATIGAKLRLWGHRRKPLPPMSPLERARMEGRI